MLLLGIVFLAVGVLFVIFAQNIWNFTGNIDFVESKFPGNTRAFIQLVGVLAVVLGLLFVTGLAGWLTGPIGDTVNNIIGGGSGSNL